MGRIVVVVFVAIAAIAVVRILAPLLAIGAVALLLVAWRRPELVGRLLGDRRLRRVPEPVRASPMRFATTVAVLTLVTAGAASAIGQPASADEVASATASGRATAEPSASPTDEPTPRPTPRRTPRTTPSPRPSPTPQPTATPASTPVFGREPTGPTQVALVASVTDGDTIRVILDGQNLPVRYIGIDTPETQNGFEWMGREAADANAALVAGREVMLEKDVSETDQYGRLLRHVWVQTDAGWTLVGLELLRLGYAQVTRPIRPT